MSTIKAQKIQPPGDSDSLQIFTNAIQRMTVTPGGLVGIGTASPTVALDVVGGIKASTTLNVHTSLTIAESELYTTQRTFTQPFSAVGSGTSGDTVVGDAWLIGTFSDPTRRPAQFKFVHNTHTKNNLQSDSYEWARSYIADSPATVDTFSEWVELPVSISVTYGAVRKFCFDVRKKEASAGGDPGPNMELRMRCISAGVGGGSFDGTSGLGHYFTFTTTGSTIYTPAAGGVPSTLATAAPLGFHGRQSYEFPVSKGSYGFTGSTAGIFILNSGNVGIGITTPTVALDVVGEARSSIGTTAGSNAKTLATKDYVDTAIGSVVIGRVPIISTVSESATIIHSSPVFTFKRVSTAVTNTVQIKSSYGTWFVYVNSGFNTDVSFDDPTRQLWATEVGTSYVTTYSIETVASSGFWTLRPGFIAVRTG